MRKTLRTPEHARFVAILRAVRLEAGLTQETLAARLSLPQSFVAKVEGGERRLDVLEFVALARALEADPVSLLRRILREDEQSGRRS